MINTLKLLVDSIDSLMKQTKNFSKEMEHRKTTQIEILEIKKHSIRMFSMAY